MPPRVLLVDNGSLEAASTRQLRRLAAELSARLATEVVAVSIAHSGKIPAEALDGRPAELLDAALDRGIAEGVREFVVLPLFIGPSYAITRHVPAVVMERTSRVEGLVVNIAPTLFVPGETRLATILVDHVREQIAPGERPRVAVVDHGSPARGVSAVRDDVTAQVRAALGDAVAEVAACSMERRDGPEFAFNDPLLAALLARPEWGTSPVIVAMLFIGPGRHAGEDGDVAEICRAAERRQPLTMTRLLGAHPLLLEILVDRFRQAVSDAGSA